MFFGNKLPQPRRIQTLLPPSPPCCCRAMYRFWPRGSAASSVVRGTVVGDGVLNPPEKTRRDLMMSCFRSYIKWIGWGRLKMEYITLQGTNVSPKNGILKMIFLFPRWDMLIPWRVSVFVIVFTKIYYICFKFTYRNFVDRSIYRSLTLCNQKQKISRRTYVVCAFFWPTSSFFPSGLLT